MSANPYQSPAGAAAEFPHDPVPAPIQPGIGVLISNVVVSALPGLAIGLIVAPLLPSRIAARLGPFGEPDDNPYFSWIGLAVALCLAAIQLGIMRGRRHGMVTALGLAYVLSALIAPILPVLAGIWSLSFIPRFELSSQLTLIIACPCLLGMGIAIHRFGKRLRVAAEASKQAVHDTPSASR